MLIELAETRVHWSWQGAGLWDQPTQWEAAERGIPQYPTKALSLEGPSCCMEMQAVQKNQLGPSKLSVNWSRERIRKFDAEELCSCCPTQGQHCICLCEQYSLGAVFTYVSLAKTKRTEKELCLKKCWYFMCRFGLSSLLICPLLWESLLWTQNWRDSSMPRYTEKSRCELSWTLWPY